MEEYSKLSDNELILKAQCKDERAYDEVIKRYMPLVKKIAGMYYMAGNDKEDIIQEGRIGLYGAITDFNADKYPAFATFAKLCIKRRIISAVKTALRQKHSPLNSYISLSKNAYEEDGAEVMEDIVDNGIGGGDPEVIFIENENVTALEGIIVKKLSDFENRVLSYYIDGKSYKEIASLLDRDTKAIDNAMQRIKKKLEDEIL